MIEVLRRPADFANRSAIRVMDELLVGSSALEAHEEGVDDQIGVGRVGHGPTDDPSGVEVDDAGEVEPALRGPELGDVGGPDLVGPGWRSNSRFTRSGAGATWGGPCATSDGYGRPTRPCVP